MSDVLPQSISFSATGLTAIIYFLYGRQGPSLNTLCWVLIVPDLPCLGIYILPIQNKGKLKAYSSRNLQYNYLIFEDYIDLKH